MVSTNFRFFFYRRRKSSSLFCPTSFLRALFRLRWLPGTLLFAPVAFWSRVYTDRRGARAASRPKIDPFCCAVRIYILRTRAYFSGPLTFPVCSYDGFRRYTSASHEHVRAAAYLLTHAGHASTRIRAPTPILLRATLFSISITAARERADVFFFFEIGSIQWGGRMRRGTKRKPREYSVHSSVSIFLTNHNVKVPFQ